MLCPGLRILFNQEIHHNQEVKFIQNQHLTDHKCHQAFLSHVHLAWSHCKSTFVWSFFAERSVFYPSTANLMRGLRFCPCVMWALLFHESQLHLLMISKWTRNWFQTFKSFKVLCNLQQISETVWRAFSPLELQVSSKNIFKNVVRYLRWFWFASSFWVNADEFVLSHPLERNNVLTCDSHFNMLVLIGCLLVICLFVCWQSTWMSIVRTWM